MKWRICHTQKDTLILFHLVHVLPQFTHHDLLDRHVKYKCISWTFLTFDTLCTSNDDFAL